MRDILPHVTDETKHSQCWSRVSPARTRSTQMLSVVSQNMNTDNEKQRDRRGRVECYNYLCLHPHVAVSAEVTNHGTGSPAPFIKSLQNRTSLPSQGFWMVSLPLSSLFSLISDVSGVCHSRDTFHFTATANCQKKNKGAELQHRLDSPRTVPVFGSGLRAAQCGLSGDTGGCWRRRETDGSLELDVLPEDSWLRGKTLWTKSSWPTYRT